MFTRPSQTQTITYPHTEALLSTVTSTVIIATSFISNAPVISMNTERTPWHTSRPEVCLLFIDYIISDVPTFNNRFGGVNRGSLTLWSIFSISRLLPWSNTIIWPLYLHCGCSAVFGQGEEQPDQHSPNAFPYNIALGFLIYCNIKNPRGNIPL